MVWKRVFLGGMALAVSVCFIIPSAWSQVLSSPDETAVAESARSVFRDASFAREDASVLAFPWLHPRSYVSLTRHIAPVGFLGWPFLLAIPRVIGGIPLTVIIATLLALSALVPLYQLLRRFGEEEALVGTWVFTTFPAWILYANRPLFPNAIVVAGALWVSWLLTRPFRSRAHDVVIGLLMGMTMAIRPVELAWIAPWWMWFGWSIRHERTRLVSMGMGIAVFSLPLAWLASRTYDGWGMVGYWLHDAVSGTLGVPATIASSASPLSSLFPYGIHVRNVAWNAWTFFTGPLFAWGALGTWCVWFLRDRLRTPLAYLAFWMTAFLLFMYGQGKYADHIGGIIAIGNSYIRYLLPLGALLAWLVALVLGRMRTQGARTAMMIVILVIGMMGWYQVLMRDDESLLRTRAELARYATIRATASASFDATSIMISDRSDKVFFPIFRVASPTPPLPEIARLAETGVSIGLFSRPLSQTESDAYGRYGLLVESVATFGNETLYRLTSAYLHRP